MAKAVQTAAILSKKPGIKIIIEADIHECLSNRNYIYENDDASRAAAAYMDSHGASALQNWEDAPSMRKRMIRVFEKIRVLSQYHYPQSRNGDSGHDRKKPFGMRGNCQV